MVGRLGPGPINRQQVGVLVEHGCLDLLRVLEHDQAEADAPLAVVGGPGRDGITTPFQPWKLCQWKPVAGPAKGFRRRRVQL